RSTCTPKSPPKRRPRPSSSRSPAQRSRRLGSNTCRKSCRRLHSRTLISLTRSGIRSIRLDKVRQIDPLRNPFSPGAGTPPPAFIGRAELLRSYEIALHRTINGRPGKSIMPIGLRGVGKTVLLNRFVEMSEDKEMLAAFIEAPETGDFKQLLAAKV